MEIKEQREKNKSEQAEELTLWSFRDHTGIKIE